MSSEIINVKQSWKESSSSPSSHQQIQIKKTEEYQQKLHQKIIKNNNLIINHQFLTLSTSSSSSSSDFSTESLISTNTELTINNNVVENLTNNHNNNNKIFIKNEGIDNNINDNDNNNNDDDIENNLFNENNNDDEELTCNIIDSSNFIQSNSPISSSSSLPPLPGLIPIRKANININNNNNNNNNSNNNTKNTLSSSSSSSTSTSTTLAMAPLSIKKSTPTNKSSTLKNGIAKLKIPISIINNNNNYSNNNNNNNNNSNSISSQNKIKSVHFSPKPNDNNNMKNHSKINNLEADNNDLIIDQQHQQQQQQQQNIDENDESKNQCTPDSNKENLSSIFSDNLLLPTKPNNLLDNQQSTTTSSTTSTTTSSTTSSSLDIITSPIVNDNNVNAQNISIKSKRGRKVKIKTEIIDGGDGNEEIIPHRKSDRRRIARDIFFLIEEYPTNRRRKNGKTCNSKGKKPRGRPKSKFAHLRATNNSSILRHQDNEPRAISPIKKQLPLPNTIQQQQHQQQPEQEQISQPQQPELTKEQPIIISTKESITNQSIKPIIKLPHLKLPSSPVPKNLKNNNIKSITTPEKVPNKNNNIDGCIKNINNKDLIQPARVNPIFLWVKQDDTRIVEVRCEDYDKRNRIRLTKTPNGWKAIPRTDPTTSRVSKLLPNPLIKIKQERKENLDLLALSTSSKDSSGDNSQFETNDFTSLKKRIKNKKKKKKKKKKKRKHDLVNEEHKERLVLKIPSLQSQNHIAQNISSIVSPSTTTTTSSSSPPPPPLPPSTQNLLSPPTPSNNDVIVYESTNHERNDTGDEKLMLSNVKEINNDINTNCENINLPNNDDATSTTSVVNESHSNNNNNNNNNNEEPTPDLTKNLTVLSDDDIEMQIPQFMVHHPDKEFNSQLLSLCPTNTVYEHINNQNHIQQTQVINSLSVSNDHHHHHHHHDVLSDSFDPSDVDTKQLKDLLDDPDLMQHCDNALTGAELIDSLVKRGCEDNHISDDDEQQQQHHHSGIINKTVDENSSCLNNNTTICLTDDFDNEDDDLLMRPEPVEDIISRLGDSLAASPKCLSFNEAGEIEGLHGELFQTNTQSDPFNRTALEELSITIKDLEKSSENFVQQSEQNQVECNTTTIVSPDSCADELPKDLTCKKSDEHTSESTSKNSSEVIEIDRPNSRSSDAIQSPQPSGLPPVPPSPDLMHSKSNKFLDQFLNATSSTSPKFCSSLTVTPIKIQKNIQHQKEPLDLGKHRKSASPTVSCSEEANRSNQSKQPIVTIDIDAQNDEPSAKRIKREAPLQNKNNTGNLMEMLSSGKDPDPLIQLKLLISNPEWKVPDPILVPKDRLNAVLASPAREIPLLLTTRPELRLPEAFAYPAILQDPDILVISMAQLESILQKQVDVTPKPKPPPVLPQVTIEAVCNSTPTEKSTTPELASPQPNKTSNPKKSVTNSNPATAKNLLNPLMPLLASGLAGDIDTATMAAFNQMLWLPYLGQMAPELFKAITGMQNSNDTNNINNLTDLLPLIAAQQQAQQTQQQQQQQQTQQTFNPATAAAVAAMAYQNPLEIAMWQQALTQAQMQRVLKLQQQQQNAAVQREQAKKNENKLNAQRNLAALFAAQRNIDYSRISNELQQQKSPSVQQSQKTRSLIGINPFRQEHNRTQLRNSSNTSITTPSIVSTTEKKDTNIRSLNPFHQNYAHGGVDITPVLRKTKQQNHPQNNNSNNNISSNNLEQKPRVTCKSLSNLLQPDRYTNPAMIDTKMSNLMAMSGFDLNLVSAVNPFQLQNNINSSGQQQNNFHQGQFSSSSSASSTSSSASGQQNNISRNSHHNSSINSQHNKNNNQQHQQQQQRLHGPKLKVKSGSHLLDPAAIQRRLLNCDDVGEVGSTTSSLDEMMMADPNTPLWHPLFGSAQKTAYNSPWQWTTVTASGE